MAQDVSNLTEADYKRLLIELMAKQGNLTGMSQQAQVAAQQGNTIGQMEVPQSRHWTAHAAQALRGGLQGAKMGQQNALMGKVAQGQQDLMTSLANDPRLRGTPQLGVAQPPLDPQAALVEALRKKQQPAWSGLPDDYGNPMAQ